MNSAEIAIQQLNEIARVAARDLTLIERSALYASARVLLNDLRDRATAENGEIDGYLSEKIGSARWHIGALTGFDVDNGHNDSQHRSWAYGALSTIASLFAERFPDDE